MNLDDWAALDEQARNTMFALRALVKSFENEDGLPREAFRATCDLLSAQIGSHARYEFVNTIRATDGQFYFKDAEMCQSTLRKIFGE